MGVNLKRIILVAAVATLASVAARAQAAADALYVGGLDNQIYFGYESTHFDYELLTPQGDKVLNNGGYSLQYNHRNLNHLRVTGKASYISGPVEGQKLMTVAAGGGLTGVLWRLEPYGELLGGMARLTSTDNIYLSPNSASSFTYILGAGVDFTVTGRWGVRPIYVENQYLSFGPKGSQYRNIGAGVLYRFGSKYYGRHRNGR